MCVPFGRRRRLSVEVEEEVEVEQREEKKKEVCFFSFFVRLGERKNRFAIESPRSPRNTRLQSPKEALDDGGELGAKGERRESRALLLEAARRKEK